MFFYTKIIELINKVKDQYSAEKQQGDHFLDEVEDALREWKMAENNFNFVMENEFIDLNIYQVIVAQKKYETLLNKARKEQITSDRIISEVCG